MINVNENRTAYIDIRIYNLYIVIKYIVLTLLR